LFGCALIALVGVAWFAQRLGASWSIWINVQVIGLIATCGIGFLGAATQTRKRWPAALALVCTAPGAQALLASATSLPSLIRYGGVPAALMIGGSSATIIVAAYLLVSVPRPIPVDRIPPARTL
jgi:hypothetical protein